MTLGQRIKKARTDANLTQKTLADELNVTFQTVSKWENDTTEPDLSTLRALAKLLGCKIEYLISDDEEAEAKESDNAPQLEEPEEPAPTPEPKIIGFCVECHKVLHEGDAFHNVERDGANGIKTSVHVCDDCFDSAGGRTIGICRDCGKTLHGNDVVHNVLRKSPNGTKETVSVCDECFQKHEAEMEARAKEIEESLKPKKDDTKKPGIFHKITSRNDKVPLIWSIVAGIASLAIILIVCIVNFETVGIGWTIGGPILGGYAVMATIYCIFTLSYISDVFMSVASWSVRFPGLIFTWDLDGFMWLIAMKILFFVLGILISVSVFLLALSISAFLSIFSFVPLLIYNKTHYE